MRPELVFLGWDQPPAKLVANWLWQAPELLRRRLVVAPTRESGRRLRELLLEKSVEDGAAAVLGPRVATPDDFFRSDTVMPDSIRYAGWIRAMKATDDIAAANLFPNGIAGRDDGWYSAVARQIEQARDLLASANLRFSAVVEKLPEESDRWAELTALEAKVKSIWVDWGFEDPVHNTIERAQHPVLPPDTREVVVAGVTDPTWLSTEAWETLAGRGTRIIVLVCAPPDLRTAFDDWGRPRPEWWTDRGKCTTPEPASVRVAADASALAAAVIQSCDGIYSTAVSVGVCASAFLPAVAREFAKAGWPTFDPQGITLARDGWPELLEALACAIEAPEDYAFLSRLARHPTVWGAWLTNTGVRSAFAALDEWEADHCPAAVRLILRLLSGSQRPSLEACGALLKRVHAFVDACRQNPSCLTEQLILWAFPFPEVQEFIAKETEAWRKLEGLGTPALLRLLAAAVASVRCDPEHPAGALPLQGWLELLFDPAPQLVLAALHEGTVPEAPTTNPLITEALREKLHFRDRKSRLAREVYLFSAMVHGRAASGRVDVVTAQVDPNGEPCQPSRVLLQADQDELPVRVGRLFKDEPDLPALATPPWGRGDWLIRPTTDTPRNRKWDHLSPSAIKLYLACPTRFYFVKVLGWQTFERFDEELNAKRFGDLFHTVFETWGRDEIARAETRPENLSRLWLGLLHDLVKDRFGTDLPPLLRLQLMSAQERLAALARIQAAQRNQGWSIIEVEKPLENLTLAGVPVRMRIDRIDRHEDGTVRVIDYKTGKKGENPRQTHLRVWNEDTDPAPLGPLVAPERKACCWTDLQLPLYVSAVRQFLPPGTPLKAFYAILPEAVADTGFVEFAELSALLDNALAWAEEAAQRIVKGVFWPPAFEPHHDDFAAIAPDGLEAALGPEWVERLSGKDCPGPGPTLESRGLGA